MVNIGDIAYHNDHWQGVVTRINRYKNGNIKSIVYKRRCGWETETIIVRPKCPVEQEFPTTFISPDQK